MDNENETEVRYPYAKPCPKCGSTHLYISGCRERDMGYSFSAHCENDECDWFLDDYPPEYYSHWCMWNISGESPYKDKRPYEEDDVIHNFHGSKPPQQ